MLQSRLMPPSNAQRLAPLPRLGDDHLCRARRLAAKLSGDEFIGKAVEAVTLDALVMQRAGNGEAANEIVLRGVEGGVEGGGLGKMRFQMLERADETQRLRLVQGRKRGQRIDGIDCGGVEGDRPGEAVAAMDDAVAGSVRGGHVEMIGEKRESLIDDAVQIFCHLGHQRPLECL
ncbi:hypothetical protein J2W92_004485 [Rhizobium leguminosarum]